MSEPSTPPSSDRRLSRAQHRWGVVLSLGMCLAVASPVHDQLRSPSGDSFPLSWYPMFAKPRPELEKINYVVGRDPEGATHRIDSGYWSNGGGHNQARTWLDDAVKAGKSPTLSMCRAIAERLASRAAAAGVRAGGVYRSLTVEIRRGRFSRERWYRDGDRTPVSDTLLVSCPVERETAP